MKKEARLKFMKRRGFVEWILAQWFGILIKFFDGFVRERIN